MVQTKYSVISAMESSCTILRMTETWKDNKLQPHR